MTSKPPNLQKAKSCSQCENFKLFDYEAYGQCLKHDTTSDIDETCDDFAWKGECEE